VVKHISHEIEWGGHESHTYPRGSWPTQRLWSSWVCGSVDANQPFEISPVSPTSLRGTRELSNVDGGRQWGIGLRARPWFEAIVRLKKVNARGHTEAMVEERAKASRGPSPIYHTASHGPQGRSREHRFEERGRGAKFGLR
jgi:hypothetical protein